MLLSSVSILRQAKAGRRANDKEPLFRRAAFVHAVTAGQAASEFAPEGQAAIVAIAAHDLPVSPALVFRPPPGGARQVGRH
jgi:hypothetical protein